MDARLCAAIEVKSFNDATGEFEGYASTYGNVDLGNDVVVKGAFDDAIAEFKSTGRMPSMFYEHDKKEPIGEWLEMKSDDKGLWVKGRIWIGKGIARAEQAYLMLKSNGNKGLSIGFIAKAINRVKDGARNVRQILKAALIETSVVGFPMNPAAQVISVKSADGTDMLDLEEKYNENRDELGRFAAGDSVTIRQGGVRGTVQRVNPQGQVVVRDQQGSEHLVHPSNVSRSSDVTSPFTHQSGATHSGHAARVAKFQQAELGAAANRTFKAHEASLEARISRDSASHAKAAELHSRASRFFEGMGHGELAMLHSQAAGTHNSIANALMRGETVKSDEGSDDLELKSAVAELTNKINNELVKSALRRNVQLLTTIHSSSN